MRLTTRADDRGDLDVRRGRHLAGDVDEARRDERLDGHAAARVGREDRVEDAVRDLVADLVGVPLGDGLGGEQAQLGHRGSMDGGGG